jgi:hypothetical protein
MIYPKSFASQPVKTLQNRRAVTKEKGEALYPAFQTSKLKTCLCKLLFMHFKSLVNSVFRNLNQINASA